MDPDDMEEQSESLKEFAHIIQEKAGPVPDQPNESVQQTSQPELTTAQASTRNGGKQALQSTIKRQSRTVVAGIGVGVGVALGYLLAKVTRQGR